MLYQCFVSETRRKYGCLVISLPPVCRPCMHIRMRIAVLCLKLEEKQVIDQSLRMEKMSTIYSN